MYINLLTTASLCAVVLASPQLERRQDVDASAIASSISSLSSALIPNPSLAAQLTSIPTSVLALQSSPSGLAQLEQEFLSSIPAWYTSLSPAAQTYILSAGPAKASIFSLESLLSATSASASATTSAPAAPSITGFLTGIINGTTATLVPITGSGGLTIASGNSTVTTKKLSTTATTETETEAKTTETSVKTSETGKNGGGAPSPIESSSKGGAAQVTGVLGGVVMGAVGLVWVL
ncbi:uncharacterized protein Bfra_010205 [Botrytis fragariae]|uniref:Uncharacterized protein n=1 Tax=Botrytis fragariae TaxID=1964551 RepID=A0A8H6AMI4_9HELO|nr:uncharacterized protein Bfra_010205 [Botrytis fragariae]KAF5870058.1 hypothetical protein Bfra_010205 [Botrytis fragariae]